MSISSEVSGANTSARVGPYVVSRREVTKYYRLGFLTNDFGY